MSIDKGGNHIVFLLLLALISTSCGSKTTTTGTSLPTIEIISSPTASSTTKFTPKISATPTDTPTVTSLPILPTVENPVIYVKNLLKTNMGCDLPCIWGITPGQTPMAESIQFFNSLGWKGAYYDNLKKEPVYWTGMNITNHDIVDIAILNENRIANIISLGIGGENPSRADYYRLQNIIQLLGKPTEVWINLIGSEVSNPVQTGVDTLLFYENKSVLSNIRIWLN